MGERGIAYVTEGTEAFSGHATFNHLPLQLREEQVGKQWTTPCSAMSAGTSELRCTHVSITWHKVLLSHIRKLVLNVFQMWEGIFCGSKKYSLPLHRSQKILCMYCQLVFSSL